MNKLQGFKMLKDSRLPAIDWKKYSIETKLDPQKLWTIRCAIAKGRDIGLPRLIGAVSSEAKKFANELLEKLDKQDLVIYYPYYIAEKSGVIKVSQSRIVIEAVLGDLWNLTNYNKKDVTVIFEGEDISVDGDSRFLTQRQMLELADCCRIIKREFESFLSRGKALFCEWSYARDCDINKNAIGEARLIFSEIRTG